MLNGYKLVDLTHTITTSIPSWQGTASFSFTIIKDYHQGNRTQQFNISSNTGTHIDAPGHFEKEADMVDAIPLDNLIVPAYVFNVQANVKSDDYLVSMDDIKTFETAHGQIPAGCLAIIHTGWCKHWQEPQRYRNLKNGTMHFPGISVDVARYLVERNVVGIAIDTFSPDGGNTEFPAHKILLNAGVYIIENIVNADKLPPTGAFVAALPMKIYDAVEAPIRCIGFIKR